MGYREVIQHWFLSIEEAAKADLTPKDYDELRNAVLYGDAMDRQILDAVKRFPQVWHIAMIPDVRAGLAPEDDDPMEVVGRADMAVWECKAEQFAAHLSADQAKMATVHAGSKVLADCLEWAALQEDLMQARTMEALVQEYQRHYFPLLDVPVWDDLPSQVANLLQRPVPVVNGAADAKGNRWLVVRLDLNCPNARNASKMPGMCKSIATSMQMVSASRSVLLAYMATRPKQDSVTDPIEDEVTFMRALKKVGIGAQQRFRMQLDPAEPNASGDTSDWWIDGRLGYLYPDDNVATGKDPAVDPNPFRMRSTLGHATRILVTATLPKAADLVHVAAASDDNPRHPTVVEKSAQRGVYASELALKAILQPSRIAEDQKMPWIQPKDVVYVLDITPYCGEAAIATATTKADYAAHLVHASVEHPYTNVKAGQFAMERLGGHLAQAWLDRSLTLYEFQTGSDGKVTGTPKHPERRIGEVDVEALKAIPGCYEASPLATNITIWGTSENKCILNLIYLVQNPLPPHIFIFRLIPKNVPKRLESGPHPNLG